jgi:cell division protease FtsH
VAAERRDETDEAPREEPQRPWRVEGSRSDVPKREPPGWLRWFRRTFGGRRGWLLVLALALLNWFLAARVGAPEPRTSVPYSVFRQQVAAGNVSEVATRADALEGTFRRALPGQTIREFTTARPSLADDGLMPLLLREHVAIDAKAPPGRSLFATLFVGLGPTILIVGVMVWFFRRMTRGGFSGLGRSKAKRYEPSTQRTTFADVAGVEEAQLEVSEIVDFLRHPDKYRRLGGAMPRGVLLSGQPGTGKTLLARAMAGEAGVPFFSLSASEFVEMVVGVGASRVRDLFEQAKNEAPAIIFIDELDAVGRARGSGGGMGGAGSDEREQTLNQILTEMDGFSGSEGVIVIASTNRPEILDSALLRPGRFDRHVVVNAPDQRGRKAILEVHTRGVPLADDVDLQTIASTTPGMVGADLRNLINEAALTAARRDREEVTAEDFTEAFGKVLLGAERKLMLTDADKRQTAYHEAGHALIGMLTPGADPVRKISIVPRGRALGVTVQSPETDRYGFTAEYLRGRIVGLLGGRAAEELVFGQYTSGAENDLEVVTAIARQMVGRWGMSDAIGPISVLPPPGYEGSAPMALGLLAGETRERFDAEVRRIIDEAYGRALDVLREERPRLDALVAALLEQETLDEVDAYRIAGVDRSAHGALADPEPV